MIRKSLLHKPARALLLVTACILLTFGFNGVSGDAGVNRVADLKARLVTERKLAPACVRLLNATGTVGCSTSGPVTAPLLHMQDAAIDPVIGERVVVVEEQQLASLFRRLLTIKALSARVKGILVIPDSPAQLSPADAFPLAEHAPYAARGYAWNPNGSGISALDIRTPIILLEEDTADAVQAHAAWNAQQGFRGPVHVAELDSTMYAAGNASACIAQGTCMPLGGHSVWAALPPVPPAGDDRPITLVLAGRDSTAFFHDAAMGADAPMSGLIAMLAAAEVLGSSGSHAPQYRRRLAFCALAGEPWGLMGSKRLLWELARGGNATAGLALDRIDQVVELGQVGLAADKAGGSSAFFVHSQKGQGFGESGALADAFLQAGDAKAEVHVAPSATPGIPPSSLMAFLRVKPSLAGVVLADFSSQFRNPFYQGRLDANISTAAVVSAATVAARALHAVAWDAPNLPPLTVDRKAVEATVMSLIGCLLHKDPGFGCSLVQGLMTPLSRGEPAHYISTLPFLGKDSQDASPFYKRDIERFLWNFLASRTAAGLANTGDGGCDFGEHRCQEGEACVGYGAPGEGKGDGMGRCLRATAKYVPSHSTHFGCKEGSCGEEAWEFQWGMSEASLAWEAAHGWPPDPEWTESNWPAGGVPAYRLYQREADGLEGHLLVAGLLVGGVSIIAVHAAQAVLRR